MGIHRATADRSRRDVIFCITILCSTEGKNICASCGSSSTFRGFALDTLLWIFGSQRAERCNDDDSQCSVRDYDGRRKPFRGTGLGCTNKVMLVDHFFSGILYEIFNVGAKISERNYRRGKDI